MMIWCYICNLAYDRPITNSILVSERHRYRTLQLQWPPLLSLLFLKIHGRQSCSFTPQGHKYSRTKVQLNVAHTVQPQSLHLWIVKLFFFQFSHSLFKMAKTGSMNASTGTTCRYSDASCKVDVSESVPADLIRRILLCIHLDLKTNTILYPGKGFDFYSFNGTPREAAT